MPKITQHRSPKIIVLAFLMSFITASIAEAHRATIFAWIEGDSVMTQSKFSGGRKAQGALIQVYDLNNNLLLEGKTDDQGQFSFKVPHKEAMQIVLAAGDGHRAEWVIKAEEFHNSESEAPFSVDASSKEGIVPIQSELDQVPPAKITEISPIELQQLIEASIDKKLEPVIKMLVDAHTAGPNIRDILGGIGYIIGLIGIATYFRYRKPS